MKLKLKHLAPYLPYKLNALYTEYEEEDGTIVTITGSCMLSDARHYELQFEDDGAIGLFSTGDFKPILRPLSDLTRVIEHNGESFIPFVALAILEYGETLEGIEIPEIENEYGVISLELSPSWFSLMFNPARGNFTRWDDGEGNSGCLRELHDKLFKWHFDVFGLIEKGLAVDINTLNK